MVKSTLVPSGRSAEARARVVVAAVVMLVYAGIAFSTPSPAPATPAPGVHIPPTLGPGIFLVASPSLADPNFSKTVVLLIEHGRDGAFGLVVNRRSRHRLDEILPGLAQYEAAGRALFLGGPVGLDHITLLYRSARPLQDSEHVVADLYVSASEAALRAVLSPDSSQTGFGVYAGYAGWGPGQLEAEMRYESWRLARVDPAFIFDLAVEDIWPELIRRTEGLWASRPAGYSESRSWSASLGVQNGRMAPVW